MEAAKYYLKTILNKHIADQYVEILEGMIYPEAMSITWFELSDDSEEWDLRAYYEEKIDLHLIHNAFKVAELDPLELELIELDVDTNWVQESLTALAPIQAGRFFLHGRHDKHLCPKSAIPVEIDANLAFGTGHHGTTKGCLIAVDQVLDEKKYNNIIDLGTGSGLLGIAAAKKMKQKVILTDIDPVAVKITQENAIINEVAPYVKAYTCKGFNHAILHENAPYDLIIANILAKPVTKLAVEVSKMATKHATLILSGMLDHQANWVSHYYRQQDFVETDRIIFDGWAALIMKR